MLYWKSALRKASVDRSWPSILHDYFYGSVDASITRPIESEHLSNTKAMTPLTGNIGENGCGTLGRIL